MKRFIFLIIFLLVSLETNAAAILTHEGKVTHIVAFPHSYGSYSENEKGLLGIYVEGLPKGCGSGVDRVVISKKHPLHDSVLSMAMLAQTSGKKVRIAYFNECTIRSESWDFAYFYILD
jgi:hypothetical protein